MFKISKKKIAENTYEVKINCPEIASKIKPGNFVFIQLKEDSNPFAGFVTGFDKKSISLVFNADDNDKQEFVRSRGNTVFSVIGPLGNSRDIKDYGNVVLIGENANTAFLLLLGKHLKKAGNKIVMVLGFDSKKHMFWDKKISEVSDKLICVTKDGTFGAQGEISNFLEPVLKRVRQGICVMSADMKTMAEVSRLTYMRLRTYVYIQNLFGCCVGRMGSSRIMYDEEPKLSIVCGAELDAHKIKWKQVLKMYNYYMDMKNENNK